MQNHKHKNEARSRKERMTNTQTVRDEKYEGDLLGHCIDLVQFLNAVNESVLGSNLHRIWDLEFKNISE